MRSLVALAVALAAPAHAAQAAAITYDIEPSHTYPSFEADHMGGLSTWRGKFNRSRGVVVLDREAKTGSIDIEVDIASVDFGHDEMNRHAIAPDIFDAARYPTATFKGRFTAFDGDKPEKVRGELTLRGVTRAVTLTIEDFNCMIHPMEHREVCGADVSASLNRRDFGLDFGLNMGFKPRVKLNIQVEALRRPG
ncbi:YceI family protein [Bordetella holmesii]|uniref:YceI-like domain protein n=2 Tax=Bordetella holmesii TaxID=35814 RepID=A0A158M8B2_9BORD|nr:YceI family protein [Bordetella holmesii]AHV92571.1 yceI-like domain protein [Bordetella holmesii ATCC 51541]AIT28173.1 yceI-like domain protein [Bordetella holmesii 44057]EWM40957.1 yceI-like domain protein [Bordetella holmesii 35009]EWM43582.1 yceI-like domain protein [Bordetella holmesii 41130]EWM44850.1 yceI-like domain protein [Bordetella holmesii 70147]